MSGRITISIIIAALFIILTSCSSNKAHNTPDSFEGSQDIIIPPESIIDFSSNSNQRNISNASNSYQQNIVNKMYDEIGINEKVIDFDVDENMLYVLNKKVATDNGIEFGDVIEAYGIEDSRLKASVYLDKTKNCSALSVRDEKLYTYDYSTGNVLVYSTGGNLKKTITSGLPQLSVDKMQVDGTGRVFLKVWDEKNRNTFIYVVDEGQPTIIKVDKLISSMGYLKDQIDLSNIYIQDFCVKDTRSILIKVFPERLCLYDINDEAVKKVSYIPDSANFIDYDSGILYHSSDTKVSIISNNFANYSSEGSRYYVGRLLINEKFPWSPDPLSLNDFQLGDIIIPYRNPGSQRFQMKQNNKYVFFLDYNVPMEENANDAKSFIYRITK